jgi:hypothetical protein
MPNVTLTPIEEKRNEVVSNNKNQWLPFFMSIITIILILCIIGILGSNIIFLTTSAASPIIHKFMPTNKEDYIPDLKTSMSGGGGCDDSNNEYGSLWTSSGKETENSVSWPYSMYKITLPSGFFAKNFQKFKNWFAESIANSYITDRILFKKGLEFFSPKMVNGKNKNMLSNQTFQMFMLSPIMFLMMPLFGIIIYLVSWVNAFQTGLLFTLLGIFPLWYSWIMTSTVSLIQFFQFFFTLTIFPIISNFTKVKQIMFCNRTALLRLFGLFICSSAFSKLDNSIAIPMFVVYLITIIKSFW